VTEQALMFHPLAGIFPLLEGVDFDQLVDDVRAHGVREPVWLYEGEILDGRNRYRAAAVAGVPCPTRLYEGDDPVAFVVSLNLKRRHLSESQRAMVAAKLATLKLGDNQHSEGPSIEGAARLLNIGHASVERAKVVHREGVPELQRAVERGDVRVSVAADVATLPVETQREIVARGEKEILETAKAIRAKRAIANRAEWNARTIELSNQNAPLPCDRRYPIILADPPWKFDVYDSESGLDRAAAAHYPTMKIEDICELPIAGLATPHAVLFLWSTAPHLQKAFQVLAAWGFEYTTNIIWVKHAPGLGYWVRNQHELLLIAKRGDMRSPPEGTRPPSIIEAPRREHSRKPDEAYALIERMYPELPKIELFARARRSGWEAWGNELIANAESRCLVARAARFPAPDRAGCGGVMTMLFLTPSKRETPDSRRGESRGDFRLCRGPPTIGDHHHVIAEQRSTRRP
jgi:N6-adenosine-specific RNA methylase IME4